MLVSKREKASEPIRLERAQKGGGKSGAFCRTIAIQIRTKTSLSH